MNAVDHQQKAHAALGRAHEYLDLRERHIDPLAKFYTDHHAWMERYCVVMASIALHLAVNNDRAAARILLDRLD
jgi:hypothetical protein